MRVSCNKNEIEDQNSCKSKILNIHTKNKILYMHTVYTEPSLFCTKIDLEILRARVYMSAVYHVNMRRLELCSKVAERKKASKQERKKERKTRAHHRLKVQRQRSSTRSESIYRVTSSKTSMALTV